MKAPPKAIEDFMGPGMATASIAAWPVWAGAKGSAIETIEIALSIGRIASVVSYSAFLALSLGASRKVVDDRSADPRSYDLRWQ